MPFNQPINDDILVTVEAPTGAGTSTITSTPVDMAGFTGALFIVRLGTPDATNNIRAQEDTTVGMGAAADLQGTLVTSGANNVVVLQVLNPGKQFFRCSVTRPVSSTIDSITTIRFGARVKPTTWPGTISFESWNYSPEGTA